MILTRLWLALALATLSAGLSPAFASDPYCLGSQCFPTMAVIDPATGKPVSPAGSGSGGGSSSGAVYGPDAAGGAPSKPPVLLGLLDASGNVRALSPTYTMPVSGTITANLGTLNGAALDASVQAVKTALGSPFQAGASIGNTAFGISGTLPAFAATPTFNIGTAPTITVQGTVGATEADGANTTLGSKADAASAAAGSTAMAIFRQLHADLIGPTYGVYNSTQPTLTNGANGALQLDVNGNLRMVSQGGTVGAVQSTPAAIANAWPMYIAQGGAVLSSTNPVPTADQNAKTTITAPGTAATAATTVQGNVNGVPVPVSGPLGPAFGVGAALGAYSYPNVNTFPGGVSSIYRVGGTATAPASTNAASIKTTNGRLYKIAGCNLSTSDITFHFTNTATAPTPGSTAVFLSRTAPASATAGKCNPYSFDEYELGWYFSTGLGVWESTGTLDSDATAPAATGAYTLSVEYQ